MQRKQQWYQTNQINMSNQISKSELKEWSVYLGNPLTFHKKRNKDNVINLSNDPNFIKNK
jgi:hypothetical protein